MSTGPRRWTRSPGKWSCWSAACPSTRAADAPEDAAAQDSLPGIEPLLHNALTAPRVRGRVDTTRHPSRLQLVREPR